MNKEEKLRKLIREYIRTQPVRAPFSMTSYYDSGRGGQRDRWSNVTDVYNMTYKAIHKKAGFDKVLYNEMLNILVQYPLDEARGFEKAEGNPVVTMGLKTARGYAKDYRFLDYSIPGAGKYIIDEELAETLIDDPTDAVKQINEKYIRNFGDLPVTDLTESMSEKARNGLRNIILDEAKRWYNVDEEEMNEQDEEEKSGSEMAEVENANSGNRYRVRKDFAMNNPQRYNRIHQIVKEELQKALNEQETPIEEEDLPRNVITGIESIGFSIKSFDYFLEMNMDIGDPIYVAGIEKLRYNQSFDIITLEQIRGRYGLKTIKMYNDGGMELWFEE
jgi:hypothetical protein